jgi:hypothetical protein
MKKMPMYAICINNKNTNLVVGEEYLIKNVRKYRNIGEDCLYLLENGFGYSSCHFTVTYLKEQ